MFSSDELDGFLVGDYDQDDHNVLDGGLGYGMLIEMIESELQNLAQSERRLSQTIQLNQFYKNISIHGFDSANCEINDELSPLIEIMPDRIKSKTADPSDIKQYIKESEKVIQLLSRAIKIHKTTKSPNQLLLLLTHGYCRENNIVTPDIMTLCYNYAYLELIVYQNAHNTFKGIWTLNKTDTDKFQVGIISDNKLNFSSPKFSFFNSTGECRFHLKAGVIRSVCGSADCIFLSVNSDITDSPFELFKINYKASCPQLCCEPNVFVGTGVIDKETDHILSLTGNSRGLPMIMKKHLIFCESKEIQFEYEFEISETVLKISDNDIKKIYDMVENMDKHIQVLYQAILSKNQASIQSETINTDNNNPKIEVFRKWLCEEIYCGEYYERFLEHGYDEMSVVMTMDLQTLKDIGIQKQGHRIKIMQGIKLYNQKMN
eukprot:11375_1